MQPPRSPLFPYTTLFRSVVGDDYPVERLDGLAKLGVDLNGLERAIGPSFRWRGRYRHDLNVAETRSEEHTSELQSHSDLVCRLLLEKKKSRRAGANAMEH